jgi:methyl-accepting chemotaxis protein
MSLSWKQKFMLLIVTTLIGLTIATMVSLSGLAKVSDAYDARGQARTYESASLALLNDWLAIERTSESLEPEQVDSYQKQLQSLAAQSLALEESAGVLSDDAIDAAAQEIRTQVEQYVRLRSDWLALNQQLGLTPADGLRATMSNVIDNELRKISISIFNDDISVISSAYRDYLSTYDTAYAQKTREALKRMLTTVREMDWQEIDIGQAIQGFDDAFSEAEQLVVSVSVTESKLSDAGTRIRNLVTEQNNVLRRELIVATSRQAEEARTSSTWLIIATAAAVLAILVITLTAASRTLVKRLNETVDLLTHVAGGGISVNGLNREITRTMNSTGWAWQPTRCWTMCLASLVK